jgi:Flp pilus assembly protein TadD
MKLDPTCPLSYGIRGAIRATCSDAKYRDGRGAVEDARRFCELVKWEVWQGLAILAAAYAEAGDFEQAVVWAEKAAAMAPDEEKAEIQEQLELHRLGKPYRGPDGE